MPDSPTNAPPGRLRRLLARLEARPRVCLLGADPSVRGWRVFKGPFRLGYGAECDLRLDGADGPDVIFEIEQGEGSLLVARAVAPEAFENFVELSLDGEPLRDRRREVGAGSRFEIVDKATRRRYDVRLEPPRWWFQRVRYLALVILALSLAGAGFGFYLHRSLQGAHSALSHTAARLAHAEAEAARTESRLVETLEQVRASGQGLARAVDDLKVLQDATERRIRTEFALRLESINDRNRAELSRLAEADTRGRELLAERSRGEVERLRAEFSDRMVDSYKHLKALETRLRDSVARGLAAVEPPGERFKRLLPGARAATLFIRTSYAIESLVTGERTQGVGLGSGFVVEPSGLALTAQHVFYPWRYEREFLILEAMGIIRVVPGSVRWTVWTVGETVLADPADTGSVTEKAAYRSGFDERAIHPVLVPPLAVSEALVQAPTGVVKVEMPVPGATDAAVFQIVDFDRHFEHLPVAAEPPAVEALDEVLIVGYPYSHLQDGVALAQGVHGFVRRLSQNLLELDAPLHPGLSGGPVLDRAGAVIGMVSAFLHSDLYGLAVPHRALESLLDRAHVEIESEERRLEGLGCEAGPVDGIFDRATWSAYLCERAGGG